MRLGAIDDPLQQSMVDGFDDVMVEAGGARALAVFVAAPAGLGDQYSFIEALLGAYLPRQVVTGHAVRQADIDERNIGNEAF